jgi:hypothetical protein
MYITILKGVYCTHCEIVWVEVEVLPLEASGDSGFTC